MTIYIVSIKKNEYLPDYEETTDNDYFEIGEVFRTKDEAEKEIDRLIKVQKEQYDAYELNQDSFGCNLNNNERAVRKEYFREYIDGSNKLIEVDTTYYEIVERNL